MINYATVRVASRAEKSGGNALRDNLKSYVESFFDSLEVYEDAARGHDYRAFMRAAAAEFLSGETKATALGVYRTFFDSYRIKLEGEKSTSLDLLDILSRYEEGAATLIERQRDRYIHSVNVFLLGLAIYSQNPGFRAAFDRAVMDKSEYPYSYDTAHEEFFYRWGLASMFHDVGYPIEIIGRQITEFIDFATDVDGDEIKIRSHLEFDNFDAEFNRIVEVVKGFGEGYINKYKPQAPFDPFKPIDLLAHKLSVSLGADYLAARASLAGFVETMAQSGFIDHGYYSSLIVLKWYGFLVQMCGYRAEYFYYPVLDSASAILLHNYYRNVLQKPPFSLGAMRAERHPIAYLLLLCDELQDWNRAAYGRADKLKALAAEGETVITGRSLSVSFIAKKGALPADFIKRKEKLFASLLDVSDIFPDGMFIEADSLDMGGVSLFEPPAESLPRPLLENLERLARANHLLYNEHRRRDGLPVEYKTFAELPDSLKYSNLCAVRGIPEKLELLGLEMREKGAGGEPVENIPEDLVELLAEREHERWCDERVLGGWTPGEKNVERKTTPYLVPYDELSELLKDYDREPVRNLPRLADMIGCALYRKK